MANVEKQRNRLIKLLKELFQLDQPDLDFGFYKIMHAKAETVSSFLENDLLRVIQDAFGEADEAKVEETRQVFEAAIKQAEDFGAPDPQETPAVKKAKAAYDDAKDSGSNEGDVYEYLYRFFERYYDNGDFMSRRYFMRETDGKAAPYSVPYDGREVYLHWANRDQYYIKTTEYLSNFTFDIARHFGKEQRASYKMPDSLKMHCRIVEASEGDHNNVKASENSERFFIIHEDAPIILENGELVIQFEYRPDPSKTGQSGIWQRKLIDTAEEKILHALTGLSAAGIYNEALRTQIGEDKNKRLLLRKYLNQYSARNTMDYFIHKDLGGFMRRELDFYIKNEIMRLDDIESADAPRVESYLAKIKVLRKIAGELVTFLTQLEEFQKKIWLKKKFVTETNYCITLDRIPKSFYGEIAENDAQHEEWVKLFAIDEIQADLAGLGYSAPLTVDFLKANPFLVLDTGFFTEEFKNNLLSEIQHIDENMDGLLINADNFQALSALQGKYDSSLSSVYIDPPYNTDASSILYKNDYKDSSWLSLMDNRLVQAKKLMGESSIICVAIDDEEVSPLKMILTSLFPKELGIAPVRSNPAGRKTKGTLAPAHEYALFYGNSGAIPGCLEITEKRLARYPKEDDKGRFSWANFIRSGNNDKRADRPKLYYPIFVSSDDKIRIPNMVWNNQEREYTLLEQPNSNEIIVYPIMDTNGVVVEKNWQRGYERVAKELNEDDEYRIRRPSDGKVSIDFKTRMDESSLPVTWWDKKEYASANYGAAEMKEFFGKKTFDFPKSKALVADCLRVLKSSNKDSITLDFFAGSGTTGHAVIDFNREYKSKRKYILVEMGEYFDIITKPRIQKAVYSKDWKNGKPVSRKGISHCFKYIRLESYEDALNNLAFQDNEKREQALAGNDDFRRDYMLKYWIDFETKDSPSLLNIDRFADPSRYALKIKKPGSDEYEEKNIDLIETFNWLIGLHVDHIDAWRAYGAAFKREEYPELPKDENTKLILDGTIKEDKNGKYHFRKIEGRVCTIPGDKTNMERTLIIWRKLTDDIEADNLMLDEWFKKYRLSTQDSEFDVIYVNGSNNLPNIRQDGETWKVRLIEEYFHQKMWDVEG